MISKINTFMYLYLASSLIVTHEIIRHCKPEWYAKIRYFADNVFFYTGYYSIYAFSVSQIYVNHVTTFFKNENENKNKSNRFDIDDTFTCLQHFSNTYIYSNVNEEKKETLEIHDLEFVKHGDVIYTCSKDNMGEVPTQYDFLIYSPILDSDDTTQQPKNTYKDIPDHYDWSYSDVKFILSEFTYGDNNKTITLPLSNDYYNFYVVCNHFDKAFLFYFIKNYTEDKYITWEEVLEGTWNIIDDNVHIHECGKDQTLLLFKQVSKLLRVYNNNNNNNNDNDNKTFVIDNSYTDKSYAWETHDGKKISESFVFV